MNPLSLLVIEDVEADFLLVQRHLRQHGLDARCRWAMDAVELATALVEGGWDAVLCDYYLPGLDFQETLTQIQERFPDLPVILLSGSIGEETAVEALKYGVWDFVLKDNLLRLVPAIERSVEEAAARRARRESEAALKEQEERYRLLSQEFQTLLDALPDGIIQLSADLKIRWANKAMVRLVDRQAQLETRGNFCHAALWNRETPCDPCPVARSFKSGRIEEGNTVTPNDKNLEIRAVPIPGASGEIESVIEIMRDITDRRKLEEQLRQAQKMEAIGTLAGGIAHDFNNILTAISGYGHIALMGMAADDPQRLNLDNILEAAERAAHLTKDLLLFSRKQISVKKSEDLNGIISKMEKFLKRVIGEDIECTTSLAAEPLPILADAHQLEQVLMNLATNARDAMPAGGAFTVNATRIGMNNEFVTAHGYGRAGAYALITVSDSGRGMDKETRQKIFEPFFTTKEVGKGTGLGLAVVYGIIKQHDGYINVYSEPDRGTTFKIYLPLTAGTAVAEEKAATPPPPARGTETILVAEDDPALRKLCTTILTDFGYTVIAAVDGEDAVQQFLANQGKIHLLLFDLIMPKRNGKEAYDAIRKLAPDVKGIFASGYAPDIIRQKAALDNDTPVLFKPMSPVELLEKVREVLDKGKGGEG
ncbi:MAG: response regulator [Thermodesulfobacteriota bacterium]